MDRTTQRKLLKAVTRPERTAGIFPVPPGGHLIVLLGLEHIEAGKSLGRLCICTSDQNGDSFFIGPKETGTVLCPLCDVSHRIVKFETAGVNGSLDLKHGTYCIDPKVLIESLFGGNGSPGIVAAGGATMRALRAESAARKAATV